MEPTPIFAELAHDGHAPENAASAHREGRPVADLLRALRSETPAADPPASGGSRVGHVPHLLSF